MIEIIQRVLANLVDILVGMLVSIVSVVFVLPIFLPYFNQVHIPVIISFISIIGLTFIIQYPFLKINQTVGKAFFSLEIVPDNDMGKVDVSLLLQREIFGKLATCYLICIPVLYGQRGGHELMTETRVIKKQKVK